MIAVTGAAGLIGSCFVKTLNEKGYNDNSKLFNELFDKVKNFIENLECEDFKIEFIAI